MRRPWRSRVWFYRPTVYFHRWSPLWFGNDEYHWRTLVIGWPLTGRAIIATRPFDRSECDEDCADIVNPWEASACSACREVQRLRDLSDAGAFATRALARCICGAAFEESELGTPRAPLADEAS